MTVHSDADSSALPNDDTQDVSTSCDTTGTPESPPVSALPAEPAPPLPAPPRSDPWDLLWFW